MTTPLKRRPTKGRWMKVRDPELLAAHMKHKDFTQARLARYVGCSRQFIHMLIEGERRTCTQQVGMLIEEALSAVPGTLFLTEKSPVKRPSVKRKATAA